MRSKRFSGFSSLGTFKAEYLKANDVKEPNLSKSKCTKKRNKIIAKSTKGQLCLKELNS